MNKKFKTKFLVILTLLFIFIFPFLIVSAAPNLDYTPMEALPGFGKTADFSVFISNLYKFGIWTIGFCALIMIVIGGYMYAASGGNNASMEKAKTFITDALVGLVLALLAYLILYIINPELIEINMGGATTTTSAVTTSSTPTTVPSTTGLTAVEKQTCEEMKSQVPSQCQDASDKLNSLLDCINEKLGSTVQISSISDGNGGVNCYQDHPSWTQCTTTQQTNCCFHTKNSCHYGGTTGSGKSCAVDFSDQGSSASNEEIKSTALSCGAGYADNEGNHVHTSVSGCGCS
jgi:hypothetical protein